MAGKLELRSQKALCTLAVYLLLVLGRVSASEIADTCFVERNACGGELHVIVKPQAEFDTSPLSTSIDELAQTQT